MNIKPFKSLQDVADFLRNMDNSENAEMGFDMKMPDGHQQNSKHPCGSACCIGGWINIVNKNDPSTDLDDAVHQLAPHLNIIECDALCYPESNSGAYDATPEQGARAIEILLETGKCDWYRALQ